MRFINYLIKPVNTNLQKIKQNERWYMTKKDIILYVLSIASDNTLSPVQIQKLLFLIDKECNIGKHFFKFVAYDYGPFDKTIYNELDELVKSDDVDVLISHGVRQYKLINHKITQLEFTDDVSEKIKQLCEFVKSCSFKELLVDIYKKYPEMAKNTAFPHWAT